MKILYVVPNINNQGGVARVLSIKTNYLIEKMGYEIHILTQNKGNSPLFFSFDQRILFHDMILKGNKIFFLLNYKKELKKYCQEIVPDIIVVADNGLKGYFVPLILGAKIPIVFECHGSKFLEIKKQRNSFFSKIKQFCKEMGSQKFTHFVALSQESVKEWNLKNTIIISNPLTLKTEKKSNVQSRKVIAVARNTYEKGLDRLLVIWQEIAKKYPDWILEIYVCETKDINLKKIVTNLGIKKSVVFLEPVKNIEDKYLDASILVMTSRSEGFGLVLIEAMSCGLPVIAYDCPVGPGSIITNELDGYLIENGNKKQFVDKLSALIENQDLRKTMGQNGQKSVLKYDIDLIMNQWNELFLSLKKN